MTALELVQGTADALYASHRITSEQGRPYEEVITIRWIQTFMERYSIVSRAVSGKLLVSQAAVQ